MNPVIRRAMLRRNFALLCPGVAANGVTSPDSAANSVFTDWTCLMRVAMGYSNATAQALYAKFGSGGLVSYMLRKEAGGTLKLFLSDDGTASPSVASSVAIPYPDWEPCWLMASYRQSDDRVQYFHARDQERIPGAFTQLGADASIAISTIFDSTAPVTIGGRNNLNTDPATAAIYRACLYAGLGSVAGPAGTKVMDFDPNRYVSGDTLPGETGEIYTIARTGIQTTRIARAKAA